MLPSGVHPTTVACLLMGKGDFWPHLGIWGFLLHCEICKAFASSRIPFGLPLPCRQRWCSGVFRPFMLACIVFPLSFGVVNFCGQGHRYESGPNHFGLLLLWGSEKILCHITSRSNASQSCLTEQGFSPFALHFWLLKHHSASAEVCLPCKAPMPGEPDLHGQLSAVFSGNCYPFAELSHTRWTLSTTFLCHTPASCVPPSSKLAWYGLTKSSVDCGVLQQSYAPWSQGPMVPLHDKPGLSLCRLSRYCFIRAPSGVVKLSAGFSFPPWFCLQGSRPSGPPEPPCNRCLYSVPIRPVFNVLSGNGRYRPHLGLPQFSDKRFPAGGHNLIRVGRQVDGKVLWVPGSYLRSCPVNWQIAAKRQLHSGAAISLPCKLWSPSNRLGHPLSVCVSVTPCLRHGLSATVLVMLLCSWGLPSRHYLPDIFVHRLHPRMNRPLPMLGQRVGEAANPGPQADIRSFFGSRTAQRTVPANSAQTNSQDSQPQPLIPTSRDAGQVTLAVINPTSILNKEDLVAGLRAHIIFASETSAVSLVQHSSGAKLQRHGLNTIWGSPVSPHVSAKTGLDTLRDHAAGVAIIGSLPLTHPCIPLSETALASLRIVEAMTRLGNVQTRLICIYGYPASYRDARLRNQELLMQALHRVSLHESTAYYSRWRPELLRSGASGLGTFQIPGLPGNF